MRVSGITLLQLIKDGKIKNEAKIKKFFLWSDTGNNLIYKNGEVIWKPGEFSLSDLYKDCYTFEIIEERTVSPLKVENNKLNGTWENGDNYCYTLSAPQRVLLNKINELVDNVNYLLKKDQENKRK